MGKGIPLTTCPICGDKGYRTLVDPDDYDSKNPENKPHYFMHWTDQGMQNGMVKKCKDGVSTWVRRFPPD
jgi:hypothetical protein